MLKNLVSGNITTTAETLPAGAALNNGRLIGPGANLSKAAIAGSLSGINLTGATITGSDFSAADPTGLTATGLIGAPTKLPVGWKLVKGAFVKG